MEGRKMKPTVFDCSLYELTKFHYPEGNLTYVYSNTHVPFDIKRVFYSYDIPGGEERGGHAHRECHQLIVAASGAFELVLDDGVNKRTVLLNGPQNKVSLQDQYALCWHHILTRKAIISVIMTNI